MPTPRRVLTSPYLVGHIRLEGADEVLAVLDRILDGWDLRQPQAPESGSRCLLRVVATNLGWEVSGAVSDGPRVFKDAVSTACALAAQMFKARMLTEERFLCLHAAAVEIDGRVIVFPSRYRAGKSILTACFAAAGYRVFNDDILFVDKLTGVAVAPGLAVRLRLPLPENLEPELRDFIESNSGPRGRNYLYLNLPDSLFAPPGSAAPIAGFVLLERQDWGDTELSSMESGTILRQLIWQNFARAGSAEAILDTLSAIVNESASLRLRYSRVSEARDLLIQHFASEAPASMSVSPVALDSDDCFSVFVGKRLEAPRDASLSRRAGVRLHERGGQIFLTNPDDDRILHLNVMGTALWHLLEEAPCYDELLAIFAEAFPDVDRVTLDRDLQAMLAAMAAHDLIEVDSARPAQKRSAR